MTQLQSEHAAKIAELEADAETREQEMTVLMAHLQGSAAAHRVDRRRGQALEGRVGLEDSGHQRSYRGERTSCARRLERTRGQLEEREFLIRRLERSESNNANVLGRIQTSMERLGSAAAPNVNRSAGARMVCRNWSESTAIEASAIPWARRTRIGRAPGCELHIDSSSVSRHHALILAGTREAIIEDLNSTNGVILNGRKVTRQVLNDGDIVTIGEIQFRYVGKTGATAP